MAANYSQDKEKELMTLLTQSTTLWFGPVALAFLYLCLKASLVLSS